MLPTKKEINLFTSEKNINKKKVKEILDLITIAKRFKLPKNHIHFDKRISQGVHYLNLDTITYMHEFFGFSKLRQRPESDTEIYFVSDIYIQTATENVEIEINLFSEFIKLNVLPNDTKQVLPISSK